jgi:dTMP kinase
MAGRIFAFDGVDGSGKSLLINLVYDELIIGRGLRGKVKRARMPGGTDVGVRIREAIKAPGVEISPLTERLLFAADNAQFVEERLGRLKEDEILLCDRWSFFTDFCYALPRRMDADLLRRVQELIGAAVVDILFICNTPTEVCLQRLKSDASRKRTPCRIEMTGDEYLARVNHFFEAAAQKEAPVGFDRTGSNEAIVWHRAREVAHEVVSLDGTQEPQALCAAVLEHLKPWIPEKIDGAERAEGTGADAGVPLGGDADVSGGGTAPAGQ